MSWTRRQPADLRADTLIDEDQVELIEKAGVEQIKVRSVLTCEAQGRRLRRLLRPRSRPRHAGQHRRGGRRHRRPVDRRARHAADHAHLPHRRRRPARRRAVERGGVARRHRHGAEPQRGAEQPGRPVVMSRNCEIVLADDKRPRARALPRALRRAAAGRRRHNRSRAARSWPNGTPTPCRSSPNAPARSNTST